MAWLRHGWWMKNGGCCNKERRKKRHKIHRLEGHPVSITRPRVDLDCGLKWTPQAHLKLQPGVNSFKAETLNSEGGLRG